MPGCMADRYCGGTFYPPTYHGTRYYRDAVTHNHIMKLVTAKLPCQTIIPKFWDSNLCLLSFVSLICHCTVIMSTCSSINRWLYILAKDLLQKETGWTLSLKGGGLFLEIIVWYFLSYHYYMFTYLHKTALPQTTFHWSGKLWLVVQSVSSHHYTHN